MDGHRTRVCAKIQGLRIYCNNILKNGMDIYLLFGLSCGNKRTRVASFPPLPCNYLVSVWNIGPTQSDLRFFA